MIPATVYALCAIFSGLCAMLLLLKYRRTRYRLLLWTFICFVGLALNNTLLFCDLVIFSKVDLSVLRTLPAVIGLSVCIWGFIWDTP